MLRVMHAQNGMQLGAGGGVLQQRFFALQILGRRKSGHGGFVKAAKNEFFLARVAHDIAHGVNVIKAL